MTTMNSTIQLDYTIQSDTEHGHEVLENIVAQVEEHGYEGRDLFGLRLALEEAIVNAIKHGNQMDSNKQVFVGCQIGPDQVSVTIKDQGEGFDPEDVPDPTDEEHLENPFGRGLMLMRSFMNEIIFNDIGNQVTLIKLKGKAV